MIKSSPLNAKPLTEGAAFFYHLSFIIVESVEKAVDFSTLTTIDASIMEKSKDFTTIFALGHGKVEKREDFPTLPPLFLRLNVESVEN